MKLRGAGMFCLLVLGACAAEPTPPRPAPPRELPRPRATPAPPATLAGARRAYVDGGSELATSYEILVYSDRVEERVRRDLRAARALCRELEGILSEWQPDSQLSRLNREGAEGPVRVGPELRGLIEASLRLARATGGAFDITWFSLGALWNEAGRRDRLPEPDELTRALACVGPDRVQLTPEGVALSPGTRIGLGGVAKGYIVERVFRFLRERGYADLIVNIGGDLRAGGQDLRGAAHRVRIADPADPERVVAELSVSDRAVATSGNTARRRTIAGRAYGHLLDPRTGWPVERAGSVSVVAPDAAMADAMATAMFVLGPDEGLALARRTPGLDVVFVSPAGVRSTLPE